MNFLNPLALWLLLIIPILLIYIIIRNTRRSMALKRIGDEALVERLTQQISPLKRHIKTVLWALALTSIIFAVARPVWGVEQSILEIEGQQVIFVVDISRSMDVQDVSPSRLQRALIDLSDLVDRLNNVDIGIVVFAQESYAYMPMTFDIDATKIFLRSISTDMTSAQGSNIPSAIATALAMYEANGTTQRLMVLVSDGESHEGDAVGIGDLATEAGVIIHTLGYGTADGGSVPIYDDSGNLVDFRANNDGSLVRSTIREDVLRNLSARTGGFYWRAVADGSHVEQLVEIINVNGESGTRERLITRPIEQFGWFVILAIVLLSIEILLTEAR